MIPQKIHYCWFGGKPLPESAKKCIASWKQYFPGYEIVEWNESNFDFSVCRYAQEAYQSKKWAFVSDYARFKILYEQGGLYFDTDVEVIRPFDDIVQAGAFMGCETPNMCNPGLGLGAEPGLELYRQILEAYDKLHFLNADGSVNTNDTVVTYVTEILKGYGFQGAGTVETVCGVSVYPVDYFCPMNYVTYELVITENTRSIHHYTATWQSNGARFKIRLQKLIGPKCTEWVQKLKRKLLGK